ncbi:MAG: sigma-70 family RNA polymerase sigma factor [Microthrixaceae bacterium]|nr:sigma-70 family RNA polymerase sigma factor [Microthrixaceae bacterium]
MADPSDNPHDASGAEQALLTAARNGDSAALESLLRIHLPGVHAVCNRMCADRGDADDAAQNALISIARGLDRFDGRSALSTWIYRVTTNACLDELRRRRRRPEPIDPTLLPADHEPPSTRQSPEANALAAETRRELKRALAELPEDFRVAVVLRDVADLDYAAIAEITGAAIGTVRSRIARGRGRLADALAAGTESAASTSNPAETT